MYRILTILSTGIMRGLRLPPHRTAESTARFVLAYIRLNRRFRAGKSVVIEMIKLNDLTVRVSSFQRKIPSNPQVFEVVLLIPGVPGNRDIDHILNDQRILLTIFLEDRTRETHQVTIERHDVLQVGPESAPRTRHFLVLRVIDPEEETDSDELEAAFSEVQLALDRLRRLFVDAGILRSLESTGPEGRRSGGE